MQKIIIKQRDDVFRSDLPYIMPALTADSDAGDVQFTARDDLASARGNILQARPILGKAANATAPRLAVLTNLRRFILCELRGGGNLLSIKY